ncbi:MAG TPA: 23S rRNA (pseudouridine(1915)-N(3))-methyltransferase RlmH, partial [Brevundimonas sp.]|nr:23S rRNA (pseudouridine(1915)-N(3))-methyltransferase RlmH [Brevundimonas sp.]HCW49580.1 23S rRNA (pseudouridine(1915)-N(3))-methyltransferase RlmH [Brevundimonas sp.]
MKLAIAAIGKPGRGPEAALADDYARRATLSGRALGLGPLELIDLEPKKPGKAPEAELLLAAAEGAHLIACDERGRTYSSRAFADHVAALRDQGERRLVFVIGGADGLDESVRRAARSTLAFGP